MKPRRYTTEDEAEILRRLRLRWANSTKQIMADFGCSRSFVDNIAKRFHVKQSKMLSFKHDANCEDARP
jgi:DNA invertase Pin-like site-specific DNA recombinase